MMVFTFMIALVERFRISKRFLVYMFMVLNQILGTFFRLNVKLIQSKLKGCVDAIPNLEIFMSDFGFKNNMSEKKLEEVAPDEMVDYLKLKSYEIEQEATWEFFNRVYSNSVHSNNQVKRDSFNTFVEVKKNALQSLMDERHKFKNPKLQKFSPDIGIRVLDMILEAGSAKVLKNFSMSKEVADYFVTGSGTVSSVGSPTPDSVKKLRWVKQQLSKWVNAIEDGQATPTNLEELKLARDVSQYLLFTHEKGVPLLLGTYDYPCDLEAKDFRLSQRRTAMGRESNFSAWIQGLIQPKLEERVSMWLANPDLIDAASWGERFATVRFLPSHPDKEKLVQEILKKTTKLDEKVVLLVAMTFKDFCSSSDGNTDLASATLQNAAMLLNKDEWSKEFVSRFKAHLNSFVNSHVLSKEDFENIGKELESQRIQASVIPSISSIKPPRM